MRALVIAVLLAGAVLAGGCSKSDPPKETAPSAESARPTVRIAISAAAASAMKGSPDAGK